MDYIARKRPITIIKGLMRAEYKIPEKMFSLKNSKYIPYDKSKGLGIACACGGEINNYPEEEVFSQFNLTLSSLVCECGKDKHGFFSHSRWCPKYN